MSEATHKPRQGLTMPPFNPNFIRLVEFQLHKAQVFDSALKNVNYLENNSL